jgi:hypothetical protein
MWKEFGVQHAMTLVGAENDHLQSRPNWDALKQSRYTGLGSKLTRTLER